MIMVGRQVSAVIINQAVLQIEEDIEAKHQDKIYFVIITPARTFVFMLFKRLITVGVFFVGISAVQAQKKFNSFSGETIFSMANVSINGKQEASRLRFSPVFNLQFLTNYNTQKHFGWFYGIGIRNIGFIYEKPNTDSVYKHRTYNLGIPVGIKLGNVSKTFFYFGYEFEIPFHYKQKLFVNEEKESKVSVWMSNRVPSIMHAGFAGVNFKSGFTIKFKYYFNNFLNSSFTETVNNVRQSPFNQMKVNVFYVSIEWNSFKPTARRSSKKQTGAERFSSIAF
ncbi:MAG: hypothetical protein MUC81_01655 [Bacteroidia bacterium]|nr:hypothetical protein [Bacteroidia bacterium]